MWSLIGEFAEFALGVIFFLVITFLWIGMSLASVHLFLSGQVGASMGIGTLAIMFFLLWLMIVSDVITGKI